MISSIRFSAIIPHYSAPESLERAVDSALAQSLPPAEIIVVDDASPEGQRPSLPREHGTRIEVIELESNSGGPARPRNVGIAHSTGDFVAFLDADDIWHSLHLETLAREIVKSEPDIVGSTIKNFSDCRNMPTLSQRAARRQVSKREVLIKSPFATSATALRRSVAARFAFDESPAYRAVEDIDLWQRLILAGAKGVKLRAETVWYFANPRGISSGKLRHLRKIYRVIEKNGVSDEVCIRSRVTTALRFCGYCFASFMLRKLCGRL